MTVMKKGEEVEIEVNKQTYTVYTDSTVMAEETRYYRVFAINLRGQSDQSDVASATTDEGPPNTAPTAGAAIPDQTVMVDATVMVQSTITDADAGDTLTWTVMSNMPTYATATVDTMGMVTITGVAVGSATITVTATDIADATVTQDIMVTVAANTVPTAGAAIADQTVVVDATVMVQSTITDADAGDTLTWTVMSNMPTYATATVDDHGYGNHHGRSGRYGHHHGDRHRYRRCDGYARHHGDGDVVGADRAERSHDQ